MPRHDIAHPAGTRLAPGLREFLGRFFNDKQLEKLEVVGGNVRITVSSVAPRKGQKITSVDMAFYEELLADLSQPRRMREKLDRLTNKQLADLYRLIKLPMPSKPLRRELIGGVERHLLSTQRWDKIING